MLDSTILDVAIGVIFLFLSVSVAASTATEALASLFNWRAATLRTGVMDLLNDQTFKNLAAELYDHALINPRGSGLPPGAPPANQAPPAANAPVTSGSLKNSPAYIQPKQFADAFIDVLKLWPAGGPLPSMAELDAAVDARVPAADNPQINALLKGIILRTGGDMVKIKTELANWFDNAMDRLSGAYKRHAQGVTFLAALAISVMINADALHVAQRIWAQPALVASIKAGATAQATVSPALLASLKTVAPSVKSIVLSIQPVALPQGTSDPTILPFGWSDTSYLYQTDKKDHTTLIFGQFCLAVLGWVITALASLFGAPFWFDTLQQVIRLKGSGPSPDEKTNKTAAAG
jgi:hypothetical protein